MSYRGAAMFCEMCKILERIACWWAVSMLNAPFEQISRITNMPIDFVIDSIEKYEISKYYLIN